MFLRTLLFFLVVYLLIKVIGRLFLPSTSRKQQQGGPGFFYQHFSNQGNPNHGGSRSRGPSQQQGEGKPRFDEIEEAEYEDVTEPEEEEEEAREK